MFDSKKAQVIAGAIAGSLIAAIPLFSFSPKVAGFLALGASVATGLVNFFKKVSGEA
jgi:hypothetical protein